MIKRRTAVLALSGGMDSCVTAAITSKDFDLALIHINYGQRTEKRELKAFNDIADFYNVEEKLVIDLPHFKNIGGSSLTDEKIEVTQVNLNSNIIPSSYVPFRNGNILSACVSWAEAIGAEVVSMGAVYEDSSGYPDCRPEFFDAFEKAVNMGTKPETKIKLLTPIINMSKKEIVLKGFELKTPFELTWSCYQNEDEACGVCDSCALRLRGFKQAGKTDPIKYKARPDYS